MDLLRNSTLFAVFRSCIRNMEFTSESKSRAEILRGTLNHLSAQRDALEAEADAIHSELTSPGINGEPPAGIKTPFVDAEGYPRGDIDIINVKDKRRRLAEINTDYKALMKQIEQTMLQLHNELPPVPTSVPTASENTDNITTVAPLKPMAKLDEIFPGSPAATAGIHLNDFLIQFGTVTSNTNNFLKSIVELVGKSVNQPIPMVVLRNSERVELSITPQPWGGRGLLGCHLSPMQ